MVTMDAGRGNEASQSLEELQGGEVKLMSPLQVGLGEAVEEARLLGAEAPDATGREEPLECERSASAVRLHAPVCASTNAEPILPPPLRISPIPASPNGPAAGVYSPETATP